MDKVICIEDTPDSDIVIGGIYLYDDHNKEYFAIYTLKGYIIAWFPYSYKHKFIDLRSKKIDEICGMMM